ESQGSNLHGHARPTPIPSAARTDRYLAGMALPYVLLDVEPLSRSRANVRRRHLSWHASVERRLCEVVQLAAKLRRSSVRTSVSQQGSRGACPATGTDAVHRSQSCPGRTRAGFG